MHYQIRYASESILKGKSVRKRLNKQLADNCRRVLKGMAGYESVQMQWDQMFVYCNEHIHDDTHRQQLESTLQRIAGIEKIFRIQVYDWQTLDDIGAHIMPWMTDRLVNASFVVRIHRKGEHDFTSTDAERYLGGYLLQRMDSARVDLHHPDITIRLNIDQQQVYLITQEWSGLGGYPLGSQGAVLSLMSGGFDSCVASYLTMRRGVKTHFVFFNLGGDAHEVGVKQIAAYLWGRFGSAQVVNFVSVDFAPVVRHLLTQCDHALMGVELKRLMLRTAKRLLPAVQAECLVTGEAIAQVSSQTLRNLNIIDQAIDVLVLRPLVAMDKKDIVAIAEHIGTASMSATIPEYCGVISDRPTAHAKFKDIAAQEIQWDMDALLEPVVQSAVTTRIDRLVDDLVENPKIPITNDANTLDVLIDIRPPQERQQHPLVPIVNVAVIELPFYDTASHLMAELKKQGYIPDTTNKNNAPQIGFYCQRGIMSQLHGLQWQEKGYRTQVYRPLDQMDRTAKLGE